MTQAPPDGPHASAVPQLFLAAGDVRCCAEPAILTTVLGSCVAVWLWDRRRSIGGLNHFVLPCEHQLEGAGLRSNTRYGDAAMDALIAGIATLGGHLLDCEAKVFGGAAVLPTERGETVGDLNVRYALARLQQAGITVAARRTGGTAGLQIRCCTKTSSVLVRALQHSEP